MAPTSSSDLRVAELERKLRDAEATIARLQKQRPSSLTAINNSSNPGASLEEVAAGVVLGNRSSPTQPSVGSPGNGGSARSMRPTPATEALGAVGESAPDITDGVEGWAQAKVVHAISARQSRRAEIGILVVTSPLTQPSWWRYTLVFFSSNANS